MHKYTSQFSHLHSVKDQSMNTSFDTMDWARQISSVCYQN